MPSPLGQLQQLTISDNSNEPDSPMTTQILMTSPVQTNSSRNSIMSKISPPLPTNLSLISTNFEMSTTSFIPKNGRMTNMFMPTNAPNRLEMPKNNSNLSTNVSMTSLPSTNQIDDDVEMTRQKILADILSEDEKHIPENFDTILNPIYFDFSS